MKNIRLQSWIFELLYVMLRTLWNESKQVQKSINYKYNLCNADFLQRHLHPLLRIGHKGHCRAETILPSK